ncbi:hypothetical protein PHYC_00242 [Phycisphaerales bacterium]|nr:hypothetical protein PHYC_00242 [Phycisphaerales bacterium]
MTAKEARVPRLTHSGCGWLSAHRPAAICMVAAGLAIGLAPTAGAQCDPRWVMVASGGPQPCGWSSMVYSPDTQQVLRFGGSDWSGWRSDDLWAWDGVRWTPLTDSGPAPRGSHFAAFDPPRHRMLIFGGNAWDNATNYGDTWEWDGASWLESSVTGPSQRCAGGMTYASGSGMVLLFGGAHQFSSYRDTWTWNGAAWSLAADTGPSNRYGPVITDDPARQRVVFFGGADLHGTAPMHNDTWEWNGSAWNALFPATSPPPRRFHAMAYFPDEGGVALFGGEAPWYLGLNDFWVWDGGDWRSIDLPEPKPQPRWGAAMVYDTARSELLLFGGVDVNGVVYGDTWVFARKPRFAQSPESTAICPGNSAQFTAIVGGPGTFSRQWQVESPAESGEFVDLSGPTFFEGASGLAFDLTDPTAETIVVSNISLGLHPNTIRFRASVSGACGAIISPPASLTVLTLSDPPCAPPCDPDVNCDGAINGFDIEATEQAVNGDFSNFCQPTADLNNDGAENGFDIETEEQRVNGAPCE